jgi:hypothetical protein
MKNDKGKKIKFGKVDIPDEYFDDKYALLRVSMMLPLNLIKDLKKLSLNDKYQGKYQVLIRDILIEWTEKQKPKRKRA